MKITDIRCAIIGKTPTLRIITDTGLEGYGQAPNRTRHFRAEAKSLKRLLVGVDPMLIERSLRSLHQNSEGSLPLPIICAVEMALLDLVGKAINLPIHKLLCGKVRNLVQVYSTCLSSDKHGNMPEDYAQSIQGLMNTQARTEIIQKTIICPHPTSSTATGSQQCSILTDADLSWIVACVRAMKSVTGDRIGLALDFGQGWTLGDAKRIIAVLAQFNLVWVDDMLTDSNGPHIDCIAYTALRAQSVVAFRAGKGLSRRQDFKGLLSTTAVDFVAPDLGKIGGLTALKWICEYLHLEAIRTTPRAPECGLLGLAAMIQICATLPDTFLALEYAHTEPDWWYDIIAGFPDQIIENGHIRVSDRPGLGVDIIAERAVHYLSDEDQDFFD